MSAYTPWAGTADAAPYLKVNAGFASLGQALVFAERPDAHSGLTVGYGGGVFDVNDVADGTVAGLTDNTTNYLVVHRTTRAVTSSTATTNWNDTTTYGRMARAIFTSGVLTWKDERRSPGGIFDRSAAGVSATGVSIADVGGYFTGTDVEAALQELGAASGGGLGWFNVQDYGAVGDGVADDTAEIQAAIDAAAAAGGGVVYFPRGVYIVGGALQDTSRSNAQLLLPRIDYVDTEQITIVLRGEFAPPPVFSVVGTTPVPDGHSVIVGTLNTSGGTAPCLIGTHGPSGTLEDFSNVLVVVRDLTFRMPSNPVLTACDFSKCAAVDLDRVVVDVGSYYVQGLTEPTTSTSYAIKLPSNNNGANTRLGTTNVIGFYKGYQFAEHTNGDNVNAWGCKQAFEFVTATYHASVFQRLMAVHCQRGIVVTGTHYVSFQQFNTEHAASGWWVTVYDIDDASNLLRGDGKWHTVLAGSGVDSTFTVNGATNFRYSRIGSATGSGDVVGPSSAVTDRIAAFDGTSGKLIKDGGKTIASLRAPAIQTVTSSATVTPTFLDDLVLITAQAAGLTLANPTGTAIDGLGIVIRIKDNGTARSISYGTQYRAIGVTLPTTTVISKTLYLGMVFNNTDTKWDVLAVGQEA